MDKKKKILDRIKRLEQQILYQKVITNDYYNQNVTRQETLASRLKRLAQIKQTLNVQ
jgi:hypothetical protein